MQMVRGLDSDHLGVRMLQQMIYVNMLIKMQGFFPFHNLMNMN